MPLVRVLTILFAVYAASRVVLRFRRGMISVPEMLFWLGLWITGAVVVLMPATADWLARLFGVERGIDAAFYVALVAMTYAFFRLYVKMRGIEQQFTKLVRKLAIEKAADDEKS